MVERGLQLLLARDGGAFELLTEFSLQRGVQPASLRRSLRGRGRFLVVLLACGFEFRDALLKKCVCGALLGLGLLAGRCVHFGKPGPGQASGDELLLQLGLGRRSLEELLKEQVTLVVQCLRGLLLCGQLGFRLHLALGERSDACEEFGVGFGTGRVRGGLFALQQVGGVLFPGLLEFRAQLHHALLDAGVGLHHRLLGQLAVSIRSLGFFMLGLERNAK